MPTILKIGLDASDYENELQKVVDQTKELQAKTAQTNSVSVKVDPSDMSDLSDVSDKVEKLEGTHEVKVNVKTSGAEKLPKSIGKAKDEAGGLVDQLKKSSGGADMLGNMFLGAGGKVEILKKGVESVGKIIQWCYELSRQSKREAKEAALEYAQQKAEISAAAEAQSQKTGDIITQMQQLNSLEKLSNVEKAKMIGLVNQMGGMYKNLGIEVDAATGKIKNLDKVAFAARRRAIKEQIRAKESELTQWGHDRDAAEVQRDTAGVPVWFDGSVRVGGEAEMKEAGKAINDANKNMSKLRTEISRLRSDLQQLDIDEKAAEDDRRENAFNEYQREVAKAKAAEESIANTRQQIHYNRQVSTYNDNTLGYDERRTAGAWIVGQSEKNLQNLKDKLAKQKASLTDDLNGDLAEYSRKEQAIFETERLILLAEQELADKKKQLALFDKAEADRKKAEEDRQKAGIKGYFVGQVRQVGPVGHVEQALKDARSAKGTDLTDEESEAVRQIAKMTYSMNNRRENDPGDLSIKTNSLTARGGFQGGAVAPDLERYNRITAENSKQSLARMRMLETNVAKILKIFEG